jgi:GGDEF domain-containing protein
MPPETRPLQVVVISPDVAVLHETSWMLEAVGYVVHATSDFDRAALWRRYALADFVILDARTIAEPNAETFAHDSDNPYYRIFLYDPGKATDFAAWYAAGAHDAIRSPVSRGELLARVRTGARFLEFERRLQQRSTLGVVAGMLSQRGLLQRLRKLETADDFRAASHTLLVTSIDWYSGFRSKSGQTATRELVSAVARAIRRAVGENSPSAYLGDGRFATLVVGQSLAEAKNTADALAKDFGSRESHIGSIPRPTLTSAVTPWTAGANADRFFNDALETHSLAVHSGGNRVLQHGDYLHELATWRDEMTTGSPFANVVAQDIMEPFPALLEQDAVEGLLVADALKRSGAAFRPYVDCEGRFVGVAANQNGVRDTHVGSVVGPDSDALQMPETIPFDASFPEIYEAFSARGCASLVVTSGDQPLGYITCDGFLSMIDPIHRDSFVQLGTPADDLTYLLVPSALGEAAATPAVSV